MTTGAVPAVLALICALVTAGLAGIATPAQLFAGLSNGGVITIAAMLVIAKGVLHTGVISRVMYRLLAGVSTPRQAEPTDTADRLRVCADQPLPWWPC